VIAMANKYSEFPSSVIW